MFSFLPQISRIFGDRVLFALPPVKTQEIDTAHEKPARALKHLLKLNHANHAILYNDRKFHNHAPHILSSSFMQGADADDLHRVYEAESTHLEPWTDAPGEISDFDWRDFLGCREYQRAFVDFFEDELVRQSYDWKQVVNEYLFSGKEPIFNSIIADLGHPLIHLAYAFEFASREVAMEALALTSTCYSAIHKYLDDPSYAQAESSYQSTSLFDILDKVRLDKQFNGLFGTPGGNNMDIVFRDREAALLNHWNAWKIQDPIAQFRESQEVAVAILTGTHSDRTSEQYDFFFVHILTTSHAVRVLLPLIPPQFQLSLVRQWWLMTLCVYVAQLRPKIDLDRIRKYDLGGRDWNWTAKRAVKSEHSTDAHYVKALRAYKECAATWGDADEFYLKAAVRFGEEFNGWGGFV
ncbi:MGS207 protein [Aspergillus piperis CBS 112811]|uniref:MGS207 protein n=1 Tax=Aspergillus piperis CBS 112811 TaxID=1448313 RepID=A0A8G1VJE5_9EURO|nr:MGS207 protein [Aspergillus piperis CBS 112811]RAH54202.1 MGS207 protein [Aspergillus piperis CBS 112811]